jgi:hypothetical protein
LDVLAGPDANRPLIALWLCTATLLALGLTRPILQIEVNVVGVLEDALDRQPVVGLMLQEKGFNLGDVAGKLPPTSSTRKSIVSSVSKLYDLDCYAAASLILAFSVVVPICKQAAMLAAVLAPPGGRSAALVAVTRAVHKWAMLDVFVLAMVVLGLSSATAWNAYLLDGFYWFLAYFFAAALLGARLARRHGVVAAASPPSDGAAAVAEPCGVAS